MSISVILELSTTIFPLEYNKPVMFVEEHSYNSTVTLLMFTLFALTAIPFICEAPETVSYIVAF